MTEVATRDYLAVILIGAGSSWARGSDIEDCIKRACRHAVDDWSSLFGLAGNPGKVNVWDVTGNDEVHWDHQGLHGDNPDAPPTRLEVREVIFPKRRR